MRAVPVLRRPTWWAALGITLLAACAEPAASPTDPEFARGGGSTDPTVTATDPTESIRDTTLDVRVLGSGFDDGSQAAFLLAGVPDLKVRTNSTRFVSSREVVANVTIDADAVPDFRDVAVTTSTGRKGIGTEMFTVLAIEELNGPSGGSWAGGVNALGVIVGFRSVGCTGSYTLPSVWDAGGATSLLPLPEGACSGWANNVNASGVIVGGVRPDAADNGKWSAARWLPNGAGYTVEFLGFAANGKNIESHGVNGAGHIVGYSTGTFTTMRALWWSPETGWRELPLAAGATGCVAYDLTEADAIAGGCYFNSIGAAVYWPSPDAAPEVLPRLPDRNSHHSVRAMNEAGVIVGYAWNRNKGGSISEMAVRWVRQGSGWQVQALGDLGGGVSSAVDVNDYGQIVGWSRKGSGGNNTAFLWTAAGGMRSLGALTPNGKSTAHAISSPSGGTGVIVVGTSEIAGGTNRAVLWRP